jgi:2-polyprenyl-3-methyl-5-hydroxy-6-metoxy-1,4-benzoquinol methylase
MNQFVPPKGGSILDLGGHKGANILHYAALGHPCDGIEGAGIYRHAFEAAQKIEPVKSRCQMHWCLIEEFEPEHGFDAVICAEILAFVVDPLDVLKRIAGWLNPGGQVFLTSTVERFVPHVRGVTLADLMYWVKIAGLKVDACYSHRCLPPQHICKGYKEVSVAE